MIPRHERDKIVLENIGLVHKVASRFSKVCPVSFEELSQEGVIGLCKAVDRFDPSKGNKLSSLAVPFITGAIMHYLRDLEWRGAKIPRKIIEAIAKVKREVKQGESLADCAKRLGIDWQACELAEVLQTSELTPELEERTEAQENQPSVTIWRHLCRLSSRQREAVVLHYYRGKTFEQVGRCLKCPPEMVEQLIDAGLAKLKRAIEEAHQNAAA